MKKRECFNCGKIIDKTFIRAEPNRHATSPNSINYKIPPEEQYFEYFCDDRCRRETDNLRYIFWAKVDRNASDSECFIHSHFEKDGFGRKIRVGKCRITGKEVRVEPLQPWNNSGQPKECFEHFELRKNYYL